MRRNAFFSNRLIGIVAAIATLMANPSTPPAQAAPADQQPATVRTTNLRITPHWTDPDHFWFRRENSDGVMETVRVDAAAGEMKVDEPEEGQSDNATSGLAGGAVPRSGPSDDVTEVEFVNETKQPVQLYWVDTGGRRTAYQKVAPGKSIRQHTYVGHVWVAIGEDDRFYGSVTAGPAPHRVSIEKVFPREQRQRPRSRRGRRDNSQSDAKWQVRIRDGKLERRSNDSAGQDQPWQPIEALDDVLEDNQSLVRPEVSPDGKVIAVWKRTPGEHLPVFTLESSPRDGGRAQLHQRSYELPGDRMDAYELIAIDTQTWQPLPTELPVIDFSRPLVRWRGEHEMLIEKIDRGHQRFRLFVLDPIGNTIRTPIDESTDTFIWTGHGPPVRLVSYLTQTDEVIYASEKSGYRHLYLVDLSGLEPTTPITSGDFLVRKIIEIDESNREVWMTVGEYHDDQDPYHHHLAKVNLDGSGFQVLTDGDGDHEVQLSDDRRYAVVSYSRVDLPPVHQLRSCETGELIATLAEAERIVPEDVHAPLPQVFSAKGRDGETDIWGFIAFPDDYDPESDRVYPVIENIYAGPHDSHVPKQYRNSAWYHDLTSLGFIVVRIDGMGTANRSKALHDVCWHNLKDAGFPDRIAWMKAAAKEYPAMDIDRVGIYGTSAGGQNACGALIFHGDFYDAAVAACGCHDNRMDKASWNEQWMGYPVGKHYSESSNIDNASQLQGDLFLIVGELDENVPPESTFRLVDALINADKRFDYLMVPGMGHSDGGKYGRQLTREFFVEKLQAKSGTEQSQEDAADDEKEVVTVEQLQAIPAESTWQLAADRYATDFRSLTSRLPLAIAPERLVQVERFLDAWDAKLAEGKSQGDADEAARLDLAERVARDRDQWKIDEENAGKVAAKYPFVAPLVELCAWQRRGETRDWPAIAQTLEDIQSQVDSVEDEEITVLEELAKQFESWRVFYADYDPQFDWWAGETAKQLSDRLRSLTRQDSDTKQDREQGDDNGKSKRQRRDDQVASATDGKANHLDPNAGEPVLVESMLDEGYPDLSAYRDVSTRHLPGVMKRFRSELRQLDRGSRQRKRDAKRQAAAEQKKERFLTQWKTSLEKFRPADQPFESWPRADQVDYHLLIAEIDYQLQRMQFERTAENIVSRAADDSGISGRVATRERLMIELRREFIADTPAKLLQLAQSEYEQCRVEMVKTAREMGFGDDWRAAVEKIKTLHVAPGEQPELIQQTADDSVQWLLDRNLISIDRLARASWRMEMMSPQRQLVNPFFTGGEVISVSFPTSGMTADQKRQSLRANNIPFVRATVHHELIPGHHMQFFQMNRFETQRDGFGTPFWLEGWALYWEFVLEENGFTRSPEERMGFLVWRAHRYSRILFSLRFHLGQMSPDQCVDFLVDNVGFDRLSAEAEVRRSVGPSYPPLYQAAYMLGAMQLRQLADRWVAQERGTLKEFHDAVMRQGSIPIALLEASLWDDPQRDAPLTRDEIPLWEFTTE
ncbi:DUF885 family protein [Allorhodopirellula solitaria]|uniref:Prolyl tripeptidyl peptidase n=1 Tax=Allorhodopirellula solitaria TaxID=2527987 RepID=A0A5C5XP39_9BACT|nr:DUF885 family protein [Allorhodopirellula solitaria]TWT64976.1 Prolyl tripeptidyl peptidase precursor [Allorhodopirellula solitaria]